MLPGIDFEEWAQEALLIFPDAEEDGIAEFDVSVWEMLPKNLVQEPFNDVINKVFSGTPMSQWGRVKPNLVRYSGFCVDVDGHPIVRFFFLFGTPGIKDLPVEIVSRKHRELECLNHPIEFVCKHSNPFLDSLTTL